MTAALNVVQSGGCNVCVAGAALAGPAAQMDCVAGEVLAMGAAVATVAAGPDRVPGAGAVTASADAESAVRFGFTCVNAALTAPCHTSCHTSTGQKADLGGAVSVVLNEGGRGSVATTAGVPIIGFEVTENFVNVHAAAFTDAGQLLAREIRTGAIVLVQVAAGLDCSTLALPAVLACRKKKGGALVFEGPVPEWKCPQCWLAQPRDCMEQPCGWQDKPKKKGGAA
jgi:hypothetical protein